MRPPPRCAAPAVLARVSLGQFPSLPRLRRSVAAEAVAGPLFGAFIGTMEPSDFPAASMAGVRLRLPRPDRLRIDAGHRRALPILVRGTYAPAWFKRLRGPPPSPRVVRRRGCCLPHRGRGSAARSIPFEADPMPAHASVNASPRRCRSSTHDSMVERFARPYSSGTFTRSPAPIFIGAFTPRSSRHADAPDHLPKKRERRS